MSGIKRKCKHSFGKEIILTCHVDPSLVGGMVLVIDGKQLDGSVKARLDTFRRNLAEIIV